MDWIRKNGPGLLLCLGIALPSWLLGKKFAIVGGPVIAILLGMVVAMVWAPGEKARPGIGFSSKYILQGAVVLLGFGMDLGLVLETGKQSLPIIVCTILTSLVIAFLMHKSMGIPENISTLVGVGSSICGGSAIAATAPAIDADDREVAQAISVIFFFNVLAAILFPILGRAIGFDTTSGESFGIFAGTAVNDTSSVTAAAATWDSMWNLGSQTLDKAVTVKLTRTLAIIPITLVLSMRQAKKVAREGGEASGFSVKKSFPMFILYFILASILTTLSVHGGLTMYFFTPLKTLSKFCIVLAMAAIGLNSNLIDLVKNSGKPILLGGACWLGITLMALFMQDIMGIW